MRRVYWHMGYAAGSYVLNLALDKTISVVSGGRHLPPWLNASVVVVGVGVVPHFRGAVLKRAYPINPLDIAYDFENRATPYIWARGHRDDPNDSSSFLARHWKPATVWLLGDLALSCFSSP